MTGRESQGREGERVGAREGKREGGESGEGEGESGEKELKMGAGSSINHNV